MMKNSMSGEKEILQGFAAMTRLHDEPGVVEAAPSSHPWTANLRLFGVRNGKGMPRQQFSENLPAH